MCRSIMSLSKITHQIWRNHPFSQANKATKRAGSIGGVYWRCVCIFVWVFVGGGLTFEKKRVDSIGGLHKIGVWNL